MQSPEMLKSGLDWNILYFLAQLQKVMISSDLMWLISLDLLVTVCTSLSVLLFWPSDTWFHIEPRPPLLPLALFSALPFSRQYSTLVGQLVTCVLSAMGHRTVTILWRSCLFKAFLLTSPLLFFFNQRTDFHQLNTFLPCLESLKKRRDSYLSFIK